MTIPSPLHDDEALLEAWAMLLSHLPYLVTIFVAYIFGRYIQVVGYSLSLISSLAYHLCEADMLCIWTFTTMVRIDLFFSQMALPLTMMTFIRFKSVLHELVITFAFMAIQFADLIQDPYVSGHTLQYVVAGGSFGLVLAYWAWSGVVKPRLTGGEVGAEFPHYNWNLILIGLIISVMSFSLFRLHDLYPSQYGLLHTGWHLGIVAAPAFFIAASPPIAMVYMATDDHWENVYGKRSFAVRYLVPLAREIHQLGEY